LQDAFPDPYSTEDIGRSYCHWYEANADPSVDGSMDSVAELRSQVFSLYMELESIKGSRTWPVNTAIWRASDFIKGFVNRRS
jgi:hypothetical protein